MKKTRKKRTTREIATNSTLRAVAKRFQRKLIGAGIISLALVGSLCALNKSRPQAKPVDTFEAHALCDSRPPSAHVTHANEAITEADADVNASQPPLIN